MKSVSPFSQLYLQSVIELKKAFRDDNSRFIIWVWHPTADSLMGLTASPFSIVQLREILTERGEALERSLKYTEVVKDQTAINRLMLRFSEDVEEYAKGMEEQKNTADSKLLVEMDKLDREEKLAVGVLQRLEKLRGRDFRTDYDYVLVKKEYMHSRAMARIEAETRKELAAVEFETMRSAAYGDFYEAVRREHQREHPTCPYGADALAESLDIITIDRVIPAALADVN